MKKVNVNGIELSYVERGSGEQTVVFSHSALLDHSHFESQIAALESRYRVIAFDHRDHGRSGRAARPYSIDTLVADAAALIAQLDAAPCHWVGLSTGGFVGMRLALRHRELLRSLTLMSTSAESESWLLLLKYKALLLALRVVGVKPVLGAAMRGLFGPTVLADRSRAAELSRWRDLLAANDPSAIIRFGNAIWSRDNVLAQLAQLQLPTLVIGGSEDQALSAVHSRRMAEAIPGAQLEIIEPAGHMTTVEKPEAVNAVLTPFIDSAA